MQTKERLERMSEGGVAKCRSRRSLTLSVSQAAIQEKASQQRDS